MAASKKDVKSPQPVVLGVVAMREIDWDEARRGRRAKTEAIVSFMVVMSWPVF